MKLGFEFFEELIEKHKKTSTEVANFLNISPQALQTWKSSNAIPSRRISQLVDLFSLSAHEIDQLLGISPLNVSFRTKRGEHLSEIQVSEKIKVRSQILHERFFNNAESDSPSYNLGNLRKAILKCNSNFLKIAQCIRNEFTIPDYRPLGIGGLKALQQRMGVRAFYMPFSQLGLSVLSDQESSQTAILYTRGDTYTALIDSDRTVDEAHFDKTHEVLHTIFDPIEESFEKLEHLIDLVCGDLIYPKKFIIEQFFNDDETSRPIKNKDLLVSKFIEITQDARFILSPRGLARAIRDAELTSASSALFNFLNSEFHEHYRSKALTYTKFGEMNFAFSNRDELQKFYSCVVEKQGNEGCYPIFSKLRADLQSGAIHPSDFADTFGLEYADAIVLKDIWSSDSQE